MKIFRPIFPVFLAALLPIGVFAAEAPKHDKHAPIEVTSDQLEVFQQENRAIFSGHVVAIQQDVRLQADKMTIYYKKQDEKPATEKKPKKAKDSATPEDNAIKKIEAEGNVFMSTPEETASGGTGTYDVEKHEIHLNNDVMLTRGKNVLKGATLVYNFDTGKSTLTSGAGAATTTDGQRVRALFVPENKDKK